MGVDVVDELTGSWTELCKRLDRLDASSPEEEVGKFLDEVVVLGGVERQSVYPGLEDLDEDRDAVTAEATSPVGQDPGRDGAVGVPPQPQCLKVIRSGAGRAPPSEPQGRRRAPGDTVPGGAGSPWRGGHGHAQDAVLDGHPATSVSGGRPGRRRNRGGTPAGS